MRYENRPGGLHLTSKIKFKRYILSKTLENYKVN